MEQSSSWFHLGIISKRIVIWCRADYRSRFRVAIRIQSCNVSIRKGLTQTLPVVPQRNPRPLTQNLAFTSSRPAQQATTIMSDEPKENVDIAAAAADAPPAAVDSEEAVAPEEESTATFAPVVRCIIRAPFGVVGGAEVAAAAVGHWPP
jgi:hypothetical protein